MGGAFGRCFRYVGKTLMSGIGALISKRLQRYAQPFLPCEGTSLQRGRGPSPDHTGNLTLDLLALEP